MGIKYRRGRGGEEKIQKIFHPLSSPPLPPFPTPPPLVFSLAFQDGGRDQCNSEFPLKKACCES